MFKVWAGWCAILTFAACGRSPGLQGGVDAMGVDAMGVDAIGDAGGHDGGAPPTPPCAGIVGFPGPPASPGGNGIVLGDLDGDGKLDMAISGGPGVLVAFGHGNGSFASPVMLPTPASTKAPVARDMTGDGRLDLVVNSTSSPGTFMVLVNQGQGAFAAPMIASGTAIALGDLNGDGRTDAVVSYGSGLLGVLFNNGTGALSGSATYMAPGQVQAGVIGDLDGDGNADVAILELANFVDVYMNAGGGVLRDPVRYPIPQAGSLAIGDVTGDGKLDLILGSDNSVTDRNVVVLANHGDGTFPTVDTYPSGTYGNRQVLVVDVNADGRRDLVLDSQGTQSVNILLALPTGGFGAALVVPASVVAVATGDVDGDGAVDLVPVASLATVLLQRGGAWATSIELSTPVGAHQVVAGDLDHDGHPDIAFAATAAIPATIGVLLNHGDGTFPTLISFPTTDQENLLTLADLDNDGAPDLVAEPSFATQADVFMNHGGGIFAPTAAAATGMFPIDLDVVDLDGDGHLDLVTVNMDSTLTVMLGHGDGTFAAPLSTAISTPSAVRAGDLDRDGHLDLAVESSTGSVTVLRGRGDGTFTTGETHPFHGAMQIIDLDGDGNLDIVSAATSLMGHGDATFTPVVSNQRVDGAAIVVRDMDGDQKLDLVSVGNGVLTIHRGHGDGTFDAPIVYAAGVGRADYFAVEDLDGDHRPDVVVSGDRVTVLYNTCH